MVMTNCEIVGKFNRADNKKSMLKILSELNGCSEDDIREVLRKNDIPESDIPKKKGRPNVAKVVKEVKPVAKDIQEVKKKAPTAVLVLVQEKIDSIDETIKALTAEKEELEEYMKEVV